MSNELQLLFPQGKEISISDENLTIKPFKFGELPKVLKVIEPLLSPMATMMSARDVSPIAIGRLLAEGGDSVIDLMIIGSKKPREWIEDLEMDEGIELLTSIFEVNADFFIQKVLPQINQKVERTSGQTSS